MVPKWRCQSSKNNAPIEYDHFRHSLILIRHYAAFLTCSYHFLSRLLQLVRADAAGYIRFVDRVGDTFRWKGENVATTEVANVVSTFKSTITTTALIEEVNVYGVHINGNEGRAGMATITLKPSDRIEEGVEPNFDFGGFYRSERKNTTKHNIYSKVANTVEQVFILIRSRYV